MPGVESEPETGSVRPLGSLCAPDGCALGSSVHPGALPRCLCGATAALLLPPCLFSETSSCSCSSSVLIEEHGWNFTK